MIVEYGVGIRVALSGQVLIPCHALCRLVVEQPCDFAAGHAAVIDVRLAARRIFIVVTKCFSTFGKAKVNLGIVVDDTAKASGLVAIERITRLVAMA